MLRLELFCKKCSEKTNHYYFMMLPDGVYVCSPCGEVYEGDYKERKG